MCDNGLDREWERPPVVSLLFIESEWSCLRGGQTRDGV